MDKKINIKVGDSGIIADMRTSYYEPKNIKSVTIKYISSDVIVVEKEDGEGLVFDEYCLERGETYIVSLMMDNMLFNGTFKDFENDQEKNREIRRIRKKLETLKLEELKELLND